VRILNDKYRLFGIINPVDLLILAVVVVLALVVADVVFGVDGYNASTTETMEMVIVMEGVRDFDDTSLKVGDEISRKLGGDIIGTLVDIRTEPSKFEGMDDFGTVLVGESTIREDVYLTIIGEAEATDEGVMFGSALARVNRGIDVATSIFEFRGSGRVVSIQPAD